MTSVEIEEIIIAELKGNYKLSNVYGLNLNKCLITPLKQTYLSSVDENCSFELWTVLEETEDGQGYKITYDEDDSAFGLGMMSKENELIDIGTYGSFIDALKGM